MSKLISNYEIVAHGFADFPIALYSEKVYCVEPHYHKEYELFWLSEGEMLLGTDKEKYVITPGTMVLIEPNIAHYANDTDKSKQHHFYTLTFDISALGSIDDPCRAAVESIKINRLLKIPKYILADSEKIFHMMKNNEFGAEIKLKGLLYNIISHILQSKQFIQHSDPKIDRIHSIAAINMVIDYIKNHYKEKISFKALLSNVSYSESHMRRLFKEKTGLSFIDYVNKYRVEKSCIDLLYSDKSISDIAVDNGFNNVQYYSKIFKMFTNTTPGQYRKWVNQKYDDSGNAK